MKRESLPDRMSGKVRQTLVISGMDTCPTCSLNGIMEIRCTKCTQSEHSAGVRFLNLPSCMPCGLLCVYIQCRVDTSNLMLNGMNIDTNKLK